MDSVYAAWIRNFDEVLSCASGGVATALSRDVIQSGGCVLGVAYSDDFKRTEYRVAYTLDELEQFKGSKYTEVNLSASMPESGGVYTFVKNALSECPVLFIGLPCIVNALIQYLKKAKAENLDKLITIGLICDGAIPAVVLEQYVDYLENKYSSKLVRLSERYKKGAWLPAYLYGEFANGRSFCKRLSHTEYGFAFEIYRRPKCFSCRYKEGNRTEDITVGDFWGIEDKGIPYSTKGTSLIITRSAKGEFLVKNCKSIEIHDANIKSALSGNPRLLNSKDKSTELDKFEQLLKKKGLIYAARHCSFGLRWFKRLIPVSIKIWLNRLINR